MPDNNQNPIDDLHASESKENIEIPWDDSTAEEVHQFLSSKEGQRGQSDGQSSGDGHDAQGGQGANQSQNSEQEGEIPRTDQWTADPSSEVTEAALGGAEVEVTAEDRNQYYKSVLHDEPFHLDIPVFDGGLTISVKERSNYEQQRVLDILHQDIKDGNIDANNVTLYMHRLQEMFSAMMVTRIGDKPMEDIGFKASDKTSLSTDRKKMKDYLKAHIWPMNMGRWQMVLESIRLFENKCRKLTQELHNQNFWKPRDSEQ